MYFTIGDKVTWTGVSGNIHNGEVVDVEYGVKEGKIRKVISGKRLKLTTTVGGARKTRRHSKRAHRKSMRR